nr:54s ribosomal protein l10, mitochondrial [Quercus suber]
MSLPSRPLSNSNMPPRLQLLSRLSAVAAQSPSSYQPLAPFLYPCLTPQRSASILSSLSDTKGAYNKRIRRGRGPSSGKGKTSGRGHKGQKQHGKVPAGFNGGQTPDWVVAGSRGFKNHFAADIAPINLNRIQDWINQKRLDASQPITLKELERSRCTHGIKDGVKLLARGKEELTTPINIVVSRASAEAIAAVERVGGSVTTRYYTNFAIRKIKKGDMDPMHSLQSRILMSPASDDGVEAAQQAMSEERRKFRYRLPDPTKRKDLEYYRDAAKRGYLSHMVQDGHGPSLFFKTPGVGSRGARKSAAKARTGGGSGTGENRLW